MCVFGPLPGHCDPMQNGAPVLEPVETDSGDQLRQSQAANGGGGGQVIGDYASGGREVIEGRQQQQQQQQQQRRGMDRDEVDLDPGAIGGGRTSRRQGNVADDDKNQNQGRGREVGRGWRAGNYDDDEDQPEPEPACRRKLGVSAVDNMIAVELEVKGRHEQMMSDICDRQSSSSTGDDWGQPAARLRSKSEGSLLPRPGGLKSAFKDRSVSETLTKRVSFADTVGMLLAHVRQLEPDSEDDQTADPDLTLWAVSSADDRSVGGAARRRSSWGDRPDGNGNGAQWSIGQLTDGGRSSAGGFLPYFSLPWKNRLCGLAGNDAGVYCLLEDQKLCLESFSSLRLRLRGTILVKNLSLEKAVFVRYSVNSWTSYVDARCDYVNQPFDHVDRFKFQLAFTFRPSPGTRLELAVAYRLPNGHIYWDNNRDSNYAFWYNNGLAATARNI